MKFLPLLSGSIFIKSVLSFKVNHLVIFICWRNALATLTLFPSFLGIFHKILWALSSKHIGWMHDKTTRGVSKLSNHWFFADAIRHFVVAWTRSDEIHWNSQRLLVVKSRVDWFIRFQKFSSKTASRITKSTISRPFSMLWGSENFFVFIFNRLFSCRSCSSNFCYIRISKFFHRSFIGRCLPIFGERSQLILCRPRFTYSIDIFLRYLGYWLHVFSGWFSSFASKLLLRGRSLPALITVVLIRTCVK